MYKKSIHSDNAFKGLLAIAFLATATKACSHSKPDGKVYFYPITIMNM